MLSKIDGDLLETARMAVVIDTNYLIHDLRLIQALSRLVHDEKLAIVIPSAVIQELDNMKNNRRETVEISGRVLPLSDLSRAASNFISGKLGSKDSTLRCQKVSEFLNPPPKDIRDKDKGDERILDCCLYIIERRELPVVMLTRDRNLSIKALANGCATCGDWNNGARGLLLAILSSGGLQALAPVDETSPETTDHGSSASSSNYHAPKRPLRKAKRVSVKEIHRVEGSIIRRRGATLNGEHALRSAGQRAKRVEKREPTALADKVATLGLPMRAPPPATPRPQPLSRVPALGRASSEFDFRMPYTITLPGGVVDLTHDIDPVDVDMDIDMSDDPDVQYIHTVLATQPTQTSGISAQSSMTHPAPTTLPEHSRLADLNAPADGEPGPQRIYLDDDTERKKQDGRSHMMSKSAVDISRGIVEFMRTGWSCKLTDLLTEKLEKGLAKGSTHARSWLEILEEVFPLPPWGSVTLMLTIVLYYWSSIFEGPFSRTLPDLIRGAIPWVMEIEGLKECPGTRRVLPRPLRFRPFTYPKSTGIANPVAKESQRATEQIVETGKLIHMVKKLLTQCDLIETDSERKNREKIVSDWVAWHQARQ
ncbi:hypothetical protein H4S03_004055 [Coemansia sp. S3946]|nr:hypothetical protein H4S03_004055 [Coemansia sp. S3946]